MIPLHDNRQKGSVPLVTYTLVALFVVIFLWDRQFNVRSQPIHFADLMMRPREIWLAMRGSGEPFAVVTLFTSMFMHGSILHLVGNCIFLLVFGSAIEDTIGSWRFALYYLGWGFAAALVQVYVEMGSLTPTIGASGAIGGVMGAYFLLFPASQIRVTVPMLAFAAFMMPAWVMLGLWFLYQVLVPQEGVANWAHAGGFLAGMLTILAMGGRKFVLSDTIEARESAS